MNTENLVILCGIGIVALLWLALRFGRVIARALLIAGGIVLAGIVALSGLVSSLASFQTARTAQTAIRATSITSGLAGVVIGGLVVVSLGAVGVAGFFYLKWKLAEHQKQLPQRRRRALPQREPEIVYIVEDGNVDLDGVDLAQWGW